MSKRQSEIELEKNQFHQFKENLEEEEKKEEEDYDEIKTIFIRGDNKKQENNYEPLETAKENFKTQQTMMEEQQNINLLDALMDEASGEDSRVSKFYFERYRVIELTRFLLIISSLVLAALQYEYEYYSQHELNSEIVTYTLFFQTLFLIYLTVLAFYFEFAYYVVNKDIASGLKFKKSDQFRWMFAEIVVFLVFPMPYTRDIKVYFQDNVNQDSDGNFVIRFYYLNECFIYGFYLRLFLAFKIGLKFTSYFTSQVGRICKFYTLKMDTAMIFKQIARNYPYSTQMIIYVSGNIFFTFGVRIAERPMGRSEDENGEVITNPTIYDKYSLSLWMATVTVPTVGYGDFYPYTTLGRITMGSCVLFGITITALFITALLNNLLHSNGEELTTALIQRMQVRSDLKNTSSHAMKLAAKLFMMKQRYQINLPIAQNMAYSFKGAIRTRNKLDRTYTSIDGESTNDMMERNFTFMKIENKQLIQDLDKTLELLKSIRVNIKKHHGIEENQEEQIIPDEMLEQKPIEEDQNKQNQFEEIPENEFKPIPINGQSSFIGPLGRQSTLKSFKTFQSLYYGAAGQNEADINPNYVLKDTLLRKRHNFRSKDYQFFEELVEQKDRNDLDLLIFEESLNNLIEQTPIQEKKDQNDSKEKQVAETLPQNDANLIDQAHEQQQNPNGRIEFVTAEGQEEAGNDAEQNQQINPEEQVILKLNLGAQE